MKVYVDTGFYVARIMPRDQWHAEAVKAVHPGMTFFTSSLVINEVSSLLQARGYLSAALEFLERIRQNEKVSIVYPDLKLQGEGWDLFVKRRGSGASAVDCTSFAIMHRLGIQLALSLDSDFRAAGFETLQGWSILDLNVH